MWLVVGRGMWGAELRKEGRRRELRSFSGKCSKTLGRGTVEDGRCRRGECGKSMGKCKAACCTGLHLNFTHAEPATSLYSLSFPTLELSFLGRIQHLLPMHYKVAFEFKGSLIVATAISKALIGSSH